MWTLGRKELEVDWGASAARLGSDAGHTFCLFKNRLWAEFGRIIWYCKFRHVIAGHSKVSEGHKE